MPDNTGCWLATQNPLALRLPGSTHYEMNLLTFAQGKQLVGDTPQRSCLFSSSQSWYAWLHLVTQPQSTSAAPVPSGRESGWGPAQALGFAF